MRAAGGGTTPGGGGLLAFALGWIGLVSILPLLRLSAEAVLGPVAAIGDDPALWRAARRSLVVAAGATAVAVALGTAMTAALLLRDPPGRRALLFLCILPVLVPPQVLALAVSSAGAPSSPFLLALDLAPPIGTPNPFHGVEGMVLLLGAQGAPLVLLSCAALVRRLPGEAVLAARGLGASPGAALRAVAWPVLVRGVLGGAGLAWVAALGNFGIAAVLGIPGRYTVLPVLIFSRLGSGGATALPTVAAMSLLLAALAVPGLLAGVLAARGVGLRAGRPFQPVAAGRAGRLAAGLLWAFPAVALGVPLLSLLATALSPAAGVPLGWDTVTIRHLAAALSAEARTWGALRNSLGLSFVAAAVLAAAAVPVALALRRRLVRGAAVATDLAYALPGACMAVATILLVLGVPGGGAAYGTLFVILFAYLVRFQALALRPVAAAAGRLDPALDDAARGLGAGTWRRIASVHLPPLAPAIVAAVVLVALLAVNEVTLSSLLSGPGTQTLGMLVFNLQDGGQSGQAAAVSLLAMLLVATLMVLATIAGRRLPAGTLPWRP